MFTDPLHVRVEDPGHLDGNVVFAYLDYFDPDRPGLEKLKNEYAKGGVPDGLVKKRLASILIELIEPFRTRRTLLEKDPGYLEAVSREGTARARAIATTTVKEIRSALGVGQL